MSIAATTVDVAVLASGTAQEVPAGNLQGVLGQILGKAAYAADGTGAAIYKADQAQATADTIQGTAQYAADKAGYLEYHLQQIAALVGYTGMTASRATSLEEHKQFVFEEALAAGVQFAEAAALERAEAEAKSQEE